MKDVEARIDELLLAEVLAPLSAAEKAELDTLLAARPDIDRHAFERAAAGVFLGAAGRLEQMPDTVSRRVFAELSRRFPD